MLLASIFIISFSRHLGRFIPAYTICIDGEMISNSGISKDSTGISWEPLQICSFPKTINYGVVILNRNIKLGSKILFELWRSAKVKITVDGGTDRWCQYICEQTRCSLENIDSSYWPDMITGDFDSILPLTLVRMRDLPIKVIETPDQNETDYTKALRQLKEYCTVNNIKLDFIYVICDTAGRFDHTIANINTLYKCEKFLSDVQIIHVSHDTLTWLLTPGKHKISIPDVLVAEKHWCAIIPFGNSNNCISSTGLLYNLNKHCLKFGELVSTSNSYSENEVTIDTDTSMIWTMGIEPVFKKYESESQKFCNVS